MQGQQPGVHKTPCLTLTVNSHPPIFANITISSVSLVISSIKISEEAVLVGRHTQNQLWSDYFESYLPGDAILVLRTTFRVKKSMNNAVEDELLVDFNAIIHGSKMILQN